MQRLLSNLGVLLLAAFFSVVVASPVQADTAEQILGGFKKTGTEAGFSVDSGGAPQKEFIVAFSQFATGAAVLLGVLFMILIIYAGLLWMSAQGNEQQVTKAKQMILGAAVGIIIVVSARAIVELALAALESVATTQVNVQ